MPAASDTRANGTEFPRGFAREVTPLSLWGGDTLIYKFDHRARRRSRCR